ncbi:peptidoglycan editing factor PgeF [Gammaproteobacteria bacterium LSUCC0112]|nr:peptidoglycan editing factor PgeF [Gammaproteobacteria bacterium LSUCC0112]
MSPILKGGSIEVALPEIIRPDWPAPASVTAFVTCRQGGLSKGPFAGFNVGQHVGDDSLAVRRNRHQLKQLLPVGAKVQWLNQVHGTHVVKVAARVTPLRRKTGDAAVVSCVGYGAVVMTADCLPVFFTDIEGTVVAVAHAGWRGLLDGVLEKTIQAMGVLPDHLMAWMGPAIAPCHFEVGAEVMEAFAEHSVWGRRHIPVIDAAFARSPAHANRFMMDIYQVARERLLHAGVQKVSGGGLCTVCDSTRFYSYRRESITGRMASLIYLNTSR